MVDLLSQLDEAKDIVRKMLVFGQTCVELAGCIMTRNVEFLLQTNCFTWMQRILVCICWFQTSMLKMKGGMM